MWHWLVSKHGAEPAVNLSNVIKSNEQDIDWQSLLFNNLLSHVTKNTTEHYLVDLFTHGVKKGRETGELAY